MNTKTSGPMTNSASNLTANDIVKIIKACGDASVSEIAIGDLYICFNGAKCPKDLTDVANIPETSLRSVPSEPVTSEEDELDRLLLSNPSAYEDVVETE